MQSRLARALFALAFVLITAVVASCSSSSNNSTSPTPPVTGPTFSFAFPGAGSVATPGTSNKRVFDASEVGSWAYRCIPHGASGMTGVVNVDAASTRDSATVQVGAGGLNFSCSVCDNPGSNSVTIKPGGYVRWYNVSAMTIHTVSRP